LTQDIRSDTTNSFILVISKTEKKMYHGARDTTRLEPLLISHSWPVVFIHLYISTGGEKKDNEKKLTGTSELVALVWRKDTMAFNQPDSALGSVTSVLVLVDSEQLPAVLNAPMMMMVVNKRPSIRV
jgi:hypothetical protein